MKDLIPDVSTDSDGSGESSDFEFVGDEEIENLEENSMESDEINPGPSKVDDNTFVQVDEGNWNFSDDSDDEEKKATTEEVFEVEPALEANREQPPDIEVGAQVVDVKCHPTRDLIVAGTLENEVICYSYNLESHEELRSSEHHDGAIRSISFNDDGTKLYTCSKDKSVGIVDTETFNIIRHCKDAHESSVYSVAGVANNIYASGDDDGILRLWDSRKEKHIFEFRCGEETVNSILSDDEGKIILAAVNDGSLAAFNVHKKKMIVQSEMYKSPFTCMSIIRNGTRLAVGSGTGNIYLFKWGEFGEHTECVTSQPEQINCMVPVGDNRVITGCEDNSIRAVNLFPHKFVGKVGRHGNYGVENISVSPDQRYLASCCQDDIIKFWDLKHVYDRHTDIKSKGKQKNMRENLKSSRDRNVTEFFADLNES